MYTILDTNLDNLQVGLVDWHSPTCFISIITHILYDAETVLDYTLFAHHASLRLPSTLSNGSYDVYLFLKIIFIILPG